MLHGASWAKNVHLACSCMTMLPSHSTIDSMSTVTVQIRPRTNARAIESQTCFPLYTACPVFPACSLYAADLVPVSAKATSGDKGKFEASVKSVLIGKVPDRGGRPYEGRAAAVAASMPAWASRQSDGACPPHASPCHAADGALTVYMCLALSLLKPAEVKIGSNQFMTYIRMGFCCFQRAGCACLACLHAGGGGSASGGRGGGGRGRGKRHRGGH